MSLHKKVGKKGEEAAIHFLREKGYSIRARNWRKHPAELDIICQQSELLVFVEVKARTDHGFEIEEWGINNEKMRILSDAAYSYMAEEDWEGEFRFDIITVAFDLSGARKIKHYPDAFFPGLEGF
jgi:putative endonuclease